MIGCMLWAEAGVGRSWGSSCYWSKRTLIGFDVRNSKWVFPPLGFLSRRESVQVCQLSFINPKHPTEWGSPRGQSQLTAREAHIYSCTEFPRWFLPFLCNEFRGAIHPERPKRREDVSDHLLPPAALVKKALNSMSFHTCIYVDHTLLSLCLKRNLGIKDTFH